MISLDTKLKNNNERSNYIAYALLLAMAIIWGGTWPIGRWLVSYEVGGPTIPPLMIALIRYFVVVGVFLLLLYFREKSLGINFVKKHWKAFSFMGLTSVLLYQTGYMFGEYFTSASDASVIIGTLPIWVIFISGVITKTEDLGYSKTIGAIFAFVGVFIVAGFSPNVDVPNRLLGDLLILFAALSYAVYSVISRQFLSIPREDYTPTSLFLVTWVSFFGFIFLVPVALTLNPEYLEITQYLNIPSRIWWGLIYLIFLSSIAAYWFYLEAIKRLNASKASIFQNLVPIFGVTFSSLFLEEIFDPLVHIGALFLIITGIILVNRN